MNRIRLCVNVFLNVSMQEWTPVDAEKVPTVCETDKEKMKLAIPPSHKEKEKVGA